MCKRILLKLISLVLFIFLVFSFSSCKKNEKATIAETNACFKIHQYEKKVIAAIPEKNITLYATNQTDEVYKGIMLEYLGNQKQFAWECVTNTTYPPKLMLCDLNNDKIDELLIILTKSCSTSSFISEAHIIKLSDMEEEKIISPLSIINENVQTMIDKDNITISYKNSNFTMKTKELLDTNESLYGNVHFGNIINYSVENNKLKAEVSAQITNTKCVGSIVITYTYSNGKYVLGDLSFKAQNN